MPLMQDIEDIIKFKLMLDFIEITLIQQCEKNPKVYRGAGSIFQDNKGHIQLKMYVKDFSQFTDLPKHNSRVLVEDSNLFYLEATDTTGIKWKAKYLHLKRGNIITAEIFNLEQIYEHSENFKELKAQFYILGKYDFPFNEYKVTEYESSLTICKFKTDYFDCEIDQHDKYMDVFILTKESNDFNLLIDLIIEALSIITGHYLQPLIKMTESKNIQLLELYSHRLKQDEKKLNPPISTHVFDKIEDLKEFIHCYVTKFKEKRSHFFKSWYRNFLESQGLYINQALVLTVSIEGILKEYFSDTTPVDNTAKISTLEEIEKISIDETIFNDIKNYLTKPKEPNLQKRLKKLVKDDVISEDLFKICLEIRNYSAHADKIVMDSKKTNMQKIIYEIDACLELFYLLLFYYIGYKGRHIEYSNNAKFDRSAQ